MPCGYDQRTFVEMKPSGTAWRVKRRKGLLTGRQKSAVLKVDHHGNGAVGVEVMRWVAAGALASRSLQPVGHFQLASQDQVCQKHVSLSTHCNY